MRNVSWELTHFTMKYLTGKPRNIVLANLLVAMITNINNLITTLKSEVNSLFIWTSTLSFVITNLWISNWEKFKHGAQTYVAKWCTHNRRHALLFIPFTHAYKLPLLTQSTNWSEPPLHRAHWPPTPTLLTVAGCQMGKSVCMCGRAAQKSGTKTQN